MEREPVGPDHEIIIAARVVVMVFVVPLVLDVRQIAVRTTIVVTAVRALKPNKICRILSLAEIALVCLIAKLVLSYAGLLRLH